MSDRASHSKAPAGHRRKWDTVEFEKVAKAREDVEKAINRDKSRDVKEDPVKRELLKIRDYKVDLDSRLGKSVIVQKNTHTGEGAGGYYCNVCDCVVKVSFGMSSIIYSVLLSTSILSQDSINFLDHINGRKHQRNMGMSMKIERSSLDQVKDRFAKNKLKLEEKKKEYDFDERMKELKEEEEKQREYKRNKKKRKHDEVEEDSFGGDPDMMAMMGFSGFGGSKKN